MGKGQQPIIVRKRGFWSSLVLGVSLTFCTLLVCSATVVVYSIKVVNDRVTDVISMSPDALTALVNWQDALPPAMADAINDRRAPEYREHVETRVSLVTDQRTHLQHPVIEVTNNGEEMVSLLALRIMVEDSEGMPLQEFNAFAATPIQVEEGWRGPLLPGTTRKFRLNPVYRSSMLDEFRLTHEISELRVWNELTEEPSEVTPATAISFDLE